MKYNWLTAMVAAAALTVSGSALAQTAGPGTGGKPGGTTGTMQAPGGAAGTTQAPSGTTGTTQGSGETTSAPLTQDVVGNNVTDAEGKKIGEVESVSGDQVIVSVGGFLGIGERQVALNKSEVTVTPGTGDKVNLKTNLTKEQLKTMPEYKTDGDASSAK